jgi:hypothetical protein
MNTNRSVASFLTLVLLFLAALRTTGVAALEFVHTTADLSQSRASLAAVAAGGKVFFAGGFRPFTDVVDVFDTSTGTWSVAHLSQPRETLSATAVGNKVLFAGGWTGGAASNVVDICDVQTGVWTTAALSQARQYMGVATVGDKAIFAGGVTGASGGDSDVVDIYDGSTGTWSTAHLSRPRYALAGAAWGNLAMFAGGRTNSKVVDVYHADTNTWSVESLSAPRSYLAATSVSGKIVFAGGQSRGADIYDVSSGVWTTADVPSARYYPAAASAGGYAFFGGGSGNSTEVDIYNANTGLWEQTQLSLGREDLAAASSGNQIFFGGGSTLVGTLYPYYEYKTTVDVFTVPEPSTLALLGIGAAGLLACVWRRKWRAGLSLADGIWLRSFRESDCGGPVSLATLNTKGALRWATVCRHCRLARLIVLCAAGWALVCLSAAKAESLLVDFENTPSLPAGPSILSGTLPMQTISIPGRVQFTGGLVLGNPTNFPAARYASLPNLYATAYNDHSLNVNLAIDIDPSFDVCGVDGLLFNGTSAGSFTVEAFSDSTMVQSETFALPTLSSSGPAHFRLSHDHITRVLFVPSNQATWDYLIDSVNFTSVPEPGTLALLGVSLLGLLGLWGSRHSRQG